VDNISMSCHLFVTMVSRLVNGTVVICVVVRVSRCTNTLLTSPATHSSCYQFQRSTWLTEAATQATNWQCRSSCCCQLVLTCGDSSAVVYFRLLLKTKILIDQFDLCIFW